MIETLKSKDLLIWRFEYMGTVWRSEYDYYNLNRVQIYEAGYTGSGYFDGDGLTVGDLEKLKQYQIIAEATKRTAPRPLRSSMTAS